MKTIKKKILPKYFGDVVTGAKQFELRKDEDDIQVGDELELIEWDGEPTGKVARCDVTYVLRNCVEYGLMDGYCIVGISTPTVDAEPVKHGEWRYDEALELEWCSECGFGKRKGDKRWYSYCPNCGAYMGVEDGKI